MNCIWIWCAKFYISVIYLNSVIFASLLPEIKNLKEFLEKSLEREVLNYTISPLSTENHHIQASLHRVDIQLAENKELKENVILSLVMKTWIMDPHMRKILNSSQIFFAEERFYSSIIPAIKTFEEITNVPETERIDVFIKYYGSRLSLQPNATKADSDAVILFEKLDSSFVNIDKHVNFGFEETLAVIKFAGKFNALCIAMKRLQPTLFNTKIRMNIYSDAYKRARNFSSEIAIVGNGLSLIENLDPKLRFTIEKQLNMTETQRQMADASESPYKTISLLDFKDGNIMVKKNVSGPVQVKVYDFNSYYYQSFVASLIPFLFKSVHQDILRNNFEFFINTHHSEFIKTLDLVQCPLDDYTHDKLWEEVRDKAKTELLHCFAHMKRRKMFPNSRPDTNVLIQTVPSKENLNAWRTIIDIFEMNGLI